MSAKVVRMDEWLAARYRAVIEECDRLLASPLAANGMAEMLDEIMPIGNCRGHYEEDAMTPPTDETPDAQPTDPAPEAEPAPEE